MNKFDSSVYKRSRSAYLWYCAFEYFVALLISDAFLAKLLSSIGISDSLTGIISTFVSLACVFQLLTILLLRAKVSNFKPVAITLEITSVICFMCLYLIPFLPVSKSMKTIAVMVCILLAYLFKYLVSTIIFKWANSYVDPSKRASYSSVKEIVSLFTGIIVSTAAGIVMDKFELANNLNGAFLTFSLIILFFDICMFVCLMMIKREEPSAEMKKSESLSSVVKNIISNKNLKSIIILGVLWDFGRYFSLGFMGTFKTKDLMLSVFAVQLINIVANTLRMFISVPFGRYSDRTSFAKGIKLGMYIAVGAFVASMLATKSTWYYIVIHTVLLNCAYAGIGQNSINIVYSYVDVKYVTQAMAIKNSVGGIVGFLSSLLGGKILGLIQANGNTFFGMQVYGQQVLSAVSAIMMVIAIVYIKKVIEKQEIMVQ